MKKFSVMIAAVIAIAISVCGCSSVSMADKFNGTDIAQNNGKAISHLQGEIWGCYLFGVFPLVTGDGKNIGTSTFFDDTVKLDNTVDMLTAKAKVTGASRVENLSSTSYSTGSMFFWILWYKQVQASANAVK